VGAAVFGGAFAPPARGAFRFELVRQGLKLARHILPQCFINEVNVDNAASLDFDAFAITSGAARCSWSR